MRVLRVFLVLALLFLASLSPVFALMSPAVNPKDTSSLDPYDDLPEDDVYFCYALGDANACIRLCGAAVCSEDEDWLCMHGYTKYCHGDQVAGK